MFLSLRTETHKYIYKYMDILIVDSDSPSSSSKPSCLFQAVSLDSSRGYEGGLHV